MNKAETRKRVAKDAKSDCGGITFFANSSEYHEHTYGKDHPLFNLSAPPRDGIILIFKKRLNPKLE